MTCSDRLTSFEPIVRVEMRLHRWPEGWQIVCRHAHLGGMMGDCESFDEHRLTHDELLDVLDCLHLEWGYGPRDHIGWSEISELDERPL